MTVEWDGADDAGGDGARTASTTCASRCASGGRAATCTRASSVDTRAPQPDGERRRPLDHRPGRGRDRLPSCSSSPTPYPTQMQVLRTDLAAPEVVARFEVPAGVRQGHVGRPRGRRAGAAGHLPDRLLRPRPGRQRRPLRAARRRTTSRSRGAAGRERAQADRPAARRPGARGRPRASSPSTRAAGRSSGACAASASASRAATGERDAGRRAAAEGPRGLVGPLRVLRLDRPATARASRSPCRTRCRSRSSSCSRPPPGSARTGSTTTATACPTRSSAAARSPTRS